MIRGLDRGALERGRELFERMCVSCHGTHEAEGSLPTSRRFTEQPFRGGSDPYSIYRTLTRGFGMMPPQTWMVPSQKYDVIHYLREAYLREHNPEQYFAVDEAYLEGLPEGSSRGPEPSPLNAWRRMDYGPNQVLTLEVGDDASNFAYKGNAIRLDPGPGGVAQGRYWMLYDHDTLRVAAAWSGEEFIDWRSIHFDGRHAIHPRVAGELHLQNGTGPGWGRPADGSFVDERLVGRDGRRYGPLDRNWAQYRGMYAHGPDTVLEYTVGGARVLELPGVREVGERVAFTRTFEIGPRAHDLVLQVGEHDDEEVELVIEGATALLRSEPLAERGSHGVEPNIAFDGGTYLQSTNVEGLHLAHGDFTLAARIRTEEDGTIVALTRDQEEWVPDGWSWFVRGGRLVVDIGWVGYAQGKTRVADGEWHDVAVRYREEDGEIRFFVDGEADGGVGHLRRKEPLDEAVMRIGFTAPNFPGRSFFVGEIGEVRFFNAALSAAELETAKAEAALAGYWEPGVADGGSVADRSGRDHPVRRRTSEEGSVPGSVPPALIAGVLGDAAGTSWSLAGTDLRLAIPRGEQTRRFTLWFSAGEEPEELRELARELVIDIPDRDLRPKLEGGPTRWPEVLVGEVTLGRDEGPFAVDVFHLPQPNPWSCRLRLSGFDFTPDGDTAYVSSWDGSLWKVSGLNGLPADSGGGTRTGRVEWRRIATGLYQPLGVKLVGDRLFITCRDEIALLHDRNGDGEIDHYECFNTDHQVTEHFHEFAMGLQADDEGNLYYAKSARHALPALVPHHGTLLKVSRDGQTTEILANGFRAANGVCMNPDGTFIVTDQEGHWNPKNRINYVERGGFYGNMYGYHDVTDPSDEAMDPPLVWITNAFDRSPGELLWVDSPRWGPLEGQLLNLSYGNGQVYVVPHEKVDGLAQGGMCALPIDLFPTGVMRGRFHPGDGQLYLAGMFAWAGNQTDPGGFYRLRYTGEPVHLPVEIHATRAGLELGFSGKLDPERAADPANYRVKAWDLKRTKNYGSPHLNERAWEVRAVRVADEGRRVLLELPEIAPTWGMEVRYDLRSAQGEAISGVIHNTIHRLP